jgi:hypothetical protein
MGPSPVSDPDADPDLAIFVSDLQEVDKNEKINFFFKFSCLLLFVGTFTSFFKDKEVTKQ